MVPLALLTVTVKVATFNLEIVICAGET